MARCYAPPRPPWLLPMLLQGDRGIYHHRCLQHSGRPVCPLWHLLHSLLCTPLHVAWSHDFPILRSLLKLAGSRPMWFWDQQG